MKGRLDIVMTESGLVSSRQKAKQLISDGHVEVNGRICFKPAYAVNDGDEMRLIGEMPKYVGRGGLKLERIIELCCIDLNGKVCMDIGASTGGFTDCMLENGASMVYSVDVGQGQLAEKLRLDSRVINMEKTDIRNVKTTDLEVLPDFISADVSFISLKLILGCIFNLMKDNGTSAVLIKPQFEAGRENIGKNGIVKSKKVHECVIADIISFAEKIGFAVMNICHSPITGSKGNIEYLMFLKKGCERKNTIKNIINVNQIVEESFKNLSKTKEKN